MLIFSTNTFEVDSLDFIADTCRYVAHSEVVPYVHIFMKPDSVSVRQILANTGFCLQPESDIGCGYMLRWEFAVWPRYFGWSCLLMENSVPLQCSCQWC